MVDISSQNNKINVTVSSSGNTANTNVTPDYAQYYSEKSKEWAISDKIVDNTDYSSKYYANESKKQADISTAKTAEVVESGNTALNNIDTAKDNAITSITNQETTSKTSLIDEGATQIGLIQNEGATQIANIQATGINTRADVNLSNLSDEGKAKLDAKVSKTGDTMTGALKIATKHNMEPIRLEMSGGGSAVAGLYINDISFYYNGARAAGIRARHNDTNDSVQLYIINESSAPISMLTVDRNHTTQKDSVSILGRSLSAFIISTYVNGTSGYRIWSNGYCEQWGRITLNGGISATNVRVSFLKKFKDSNYFFETNQDANAPGGTRVLCGWQAVNGMSVGFDPTAGTTGTNGQVSWRACGYLASGQY